MKTKELSQNVQQCFTTAFIEVFTDSLAQTSTFVSSAQIPDSEPAVDCPDDVRIIVTFEGSLSGGLLLRVNHNDAANLSAVLLGPSGGEVVEPISEPLLGMVGEVLDRLSASLASKFGVFTGTCILVQENDPEIGSNMAPPVGLRVSGRTSGDISVWISLSKTLIEALESHALDHDWELDEPAGGGEVAVEPINLDLVLDVELDVTLRFGRRQLTLREVLELTSGSVIELDRQVEEPVELLLEGKVIARGEAVVIDGNYGLRVTEVPRAIAAALL